MSQPVRNIFEVYIHTTPEKLWDAITNGELMQQYFYGGRLKATPRKPGDRLTYIDDDDGFTMLDGEVLEIDPPRKLVQTFEHKWETHMDPVPSRVTWEITQLGGTCKLALEHVFERDGEIVEQTRSGWSVILSGLKTLLETGGPLTIEFPVEAKA
ncbi:MAG: SRPBCC family protein [Vulcanimicrobiaceae bacterium]